MDAGLRRGAPDPVTDFDAFGRIHHDRQEAVVADQKGFAAQRDPPVHLRRSRITAIRVPASGPNGLTT